MKGAFRSLFFQHSQGSAHPLKALNLKGNNTGSSFYTQSRKSSFSLKNLLVLQVMVLSDSILNFG